MKGRIALLLALFTLFLSTESSFMLHFCHNQLVTASVNKEISTCCKKKEHPGPVVRGICCELSSFDTQLNDTVLNDNSIAIMLPTYFAVMCDAMATDVIVKDRLHQHITRPPPRLSKRDLQILYAQYLI
jgi:hypothetical protein